MDRNFLMHVHFVGYLNLFVNWIGLRHFNLHWYFYLFVYGYLDFLLYWVRFRNFLDYSYNLLFFLLLLLFNRYLKDYLLKLHY